MGDPPSLRVDTPALNWTPADVTVPPVPVIAPGPDPMSTMIAAIMPELGVPLATAVAETRAREERFAANLVAARNAYQTTDDAGEQEIRTVSDAQLAAASAPTGVSTAAGSGMGEMGQLLGTATQMAGQAVQAPIQAMGMAASLPQGVMQGTQSVIQQFGQVAGQAGEDGDEPPNDAQRNSAEHHVEYPAEDDKDTSADSRGAGAEASPSTNERAPVGELATPHLPSADGPPLTSHGSDAVDL